jgi:hypothetical protein
MLMVAFVFIFTSFYLLARLITRTIGVDRRMGSIKYRALLLGIASLPVLVLAMQSLGQLTVRDLITLAVLYGLGYFYVSRMAVPEKQ